MYLLPEKYDVEPFMKVLIELGWKDSRTNGLEENQLFRKYILLS
jgi:hypothetical protein